MVIWLGVFRPVKKIGKLQTWFSWVGKKKVCVCFGAGGAEILLKAEAVWHLVHACSLRKILIVNFCHSIFYGNTFLKVQIPILSFICNMNNFFDTFWMMIERMLEFSSKLSWETFYSPGFVRACIMGYGLRAEKLLVIRVVLWCTNAPSGPLPGKTKKTTMLLIHTLIYNKYIIGSAFSASSCTGFLTEVCKRVQKRW